MDADRSSELIEQVRAAVSARRALRIVGGDSKAFYGRSCRSDEVLSVADHRGIVNYEPGELIISARAGTPLIEVEAALAEHGQMLAFEPPHYGEHATLGGTLAGNFSGPRRPYAGAARDFLLGADIINGHGEPGEPGEPGQNGQALRFGGQVMKNVAGYDISRLMAGALGTLGVLLKLTFKVLPRPAATLTLRHETSAADALQRMNLWAGKPLPITASAFDGAVLHTRLEGTASALHAARATLGGEIETRENFWVEVREHRHGFFRDTRPLWRIALPPATPPLALEGKTFIEWNGGLRWLYADAPAARIRASVAGCGGHALAFRGGDRDGEIFQPLAPALAQLHRQLKTAFDPHGIFNPGRMYENL